jgi:hypothetical protein
MAAAERAGARSKRIVLRRLGQPNTHMNVSAKTVQASNLRASRLLRYVGGCCTNRIEPADFAETCKELPL